MYISKPEKATDIAVRPHRNIDEWQKNSITCLSPPPSPPPYDMLRFANHSNRNTYTPKGTNRRGSYLTRFDSAKETRTTHVKAK